MLMSVLSFKNKDIDMEMILPSKELLSAVLGNSRISSDGYFQEEKNLIHYGCIYGNAPDDYYDEQECINIYELMHLMKEWAWEKDYLIKSSTDGEALIRMYGQHDYIKSFDNIHEFEAVTKACEWILKKTND